MRILFHLAAVVLLPALLGCSEQQAVENNADPAWAVAAPQDSYDLSTLSLKQLYDRSQNLAAKSRELNSDMQRDIDETKDRLGSRVNDPSSNAEAERTRSTWPPRIQAVEADIRATMEEIGTRCPKGAVLNSTEQRCN